MGWVEEERPSSRWAPDDIERWVRRGHGLWRSTTVGDTLRPLLRHGSLTPAQEAVCLLGVADHNQDEIERALTLGADLHLDPDVGARLLSAAARALGPADDPRIARVLDQCRERAAAAVTPLGRLAPARADVELAIRGHDAGVVTAAVARLGDVGPSEPDDDDAAAVVLSLRLAALMRLAELGAALSGDDVAGVLTEAEPRAAAVSAPAMACGLLATAAEVALVVERPADAVRLADRAVAAAATPEAEPPESLGHELERLVNRARWRAGESGAVAAGLTAAGLHEPLAVLWCEDGYRALVAGQMEEASRAVEEARTVAAQLATGREGPEAVAAHHRVTVVVETLAARVHESQEDPYRELASWSEVIAAKVALGMATVDDRSAAGLAAALAGEPSAGPLFEAAEDELTRGGHGWPAPVIDRSRALLLHRRAEWRRLHGRLGEAATDAETAIDLYRRLDQHEDAAGVAHQLAVVRRLDGDDLDLVLATVAAGLADCHRAGVAATSLAAVRLHLLAAVVLDDAGRPADAERHLRAAGARPGDDGNADDASLAVLEREQEARWGELGPAALAALAADAEPSVRRAVAGRSDLPEAQARTLLDDRDASVREAAGANPVVPLSLIDPAGRKWRSAPAVRRAAARRVDASPAMLRLLAGTGARWDTRRYVAANPVTPPDLLKQLAHDVPAVRAAVAANPNTPPDVLDTLAHDMAEYVRFEVAGNPSASPATVAALVKRRSPWIRGRALGNPALGADSLAAALAPMTDSAWMLRAGASNPACPQELADQVLTWLALGGAEGDAAFDPQTCNGHPGPDNTVAPDQWYWKEAFHAGADHSPLWRIRARYPDRAGVLTAANQERLRRDPAPEVRRNLFRYQLDPTHLEELADDEDATVRARAAYALAQLQTPEARKQRRQAAWRMRRSHLARVAGLAAALVLGFVPLALYPTVNSDRADTAGLPAIGLWEPTTTGDPFASMLSELDPSADDGPVRPVLILGDRPIDDGLSVIAGPVPLGSDAEVVVGRRDPMALVIRISARNPITVDGVTAFATSLDSEVGTIVGVEMSIPGGAAADLATASSAVAEAERIRVTMGDEQAELILREP